MPLAAGSTLGPYEIVSPLGAGGMGEVYKARDIRLDRPVAITVTSTILAETPELRDRFAVTSDGLRFLTVESPPNAAPVSVRVYTGLAAMPRN